MRLNICAIHALNNILKGLYGFYELKTKGIDFKT